MLESVSVEHGAIAEVSLRRPPQVASGDYSKAVQDYNRALELAPLASDTWVVYLNRGCVLNKLGDSEGALQDLNEALSLKPNDVSPMHL